MKKGGERCLATASAYEARQRRGGPWLEELEEVEGSDFEHTCQTLGRLKNEDLADEVNAQGVGANTQHLVLFNERGEKYIFPILGNNRGESEILIGRIHRFDLLGGGCTEDFDDLNQLIDIAISREERLSDQKLRQNTASTPNINR